MTPSREPTASTATSGATASSTPANAGDLSRRMIALALARGFADAGVTPIAPSSWGAHLRDWLAAGKHASMSYLADHVAELLDPSLAIPRARSLLLVADQYAPRADPEPPPPAGHGKIARYARGRDYHDVIKRRLHALCDALRVEFRGEYFRAFVDTVPVLEREQAARAGLGWVGKHTLLLHPRRGSYFFLAGVATSLQLPALADRPPEPDSCGTCTRCIDACPTRAITPHSVDASRCISYLTIEHRAPIDPSLHAAIGEWIYGCDVCQEVCPHNSPRSLSRSAARSSPDVPPIAAAYNEQRRSLPLLDVLGWTRDDRTRELSGSPMKRATLAMFRRNAIIVAANTLRAQDRITFLDRLREIAADAHENDMVRTTAAHTIERLTHAPDQAERV